MDTKSITRFGNRVDDYVKYRPGYPEEIVDFLQSKYNFVSGDVIADIGSGTGISSIRFLDKGYRVIGIEPNKEMREKSVELLDENPNFSAVNGTSENTTLADESVDAIVVGQAFHWFNREQTKVEFSRILKPRGVVVLIWNERLTASDFEKEYDELIIKHGRDYVQVDHRNIDLAKIAEFFSPATVLQETFKNIQMFNFQGLEGRLLSSSYMPAKNDEGYPCNGKGLRIAV